MTDSREVSIKFTVETAGGVAKVKNMTAAIKKAGESVKKTGKESTAAAKKFSKASRSMQTAAQRTEKKMRKLRASLGALKEGLRSLAQTARRTAAVMIGGAAAVTAVYSRFERAMIRTTAVAVGGEKGFSNAFRSMSKEAMKVANTTEHTAKQVGEGMEFMAMAGLKPAQILKATASAADLASTAGIGMADAANIATNVMTAFGMKAENLGRVNNILAGTFTNSNVNIMQLGEAFKVAGANASVLGISLKEVSVALGLLGNVGVQGTEAGTGLKRAMSALVKPTRQSSVAMGRLGLDTKILTESSKNMSGGLLRVVATLQGAQKAYMDAGKDTEFLADLFTVFGERAGPKMAALIKQGTSAFIDLSFAVDNAISKDVASWIAGIQRESVKGKFDILVSNLESAAITIGESLAPAAKDLMDTMKGLAESVASMSKEQMQALASIVKIVSFVTALSATFLTLAGALATVKFAWLSLGLPALTVSIASLKAGVVALFGAIVTKTAIAGMAFVSMSKLMVASMLTVTGALKASALIMFALPLAIAGVALLISRLTRDVGFFEEKMKNGTVQAFSFAEAFNDLEGSLSVLGHSVYDLFNPFQDMISLLDDIVERARILEALSMGGFLGAGAVASAGSMGGRQSHTSFSIRETFEGIKSETRLPSGVTIDTKLITDAVSRINSSIETMPTEKLKSSSMLLASSVKNVEELGRVAKQKFAEMREGISDVETLAEIGGQEKGITLKISQMLEQILNVSKRLAKEQAAREKADSEARAKARAWSKAMRSMFDDLIKKTNQMKVGLISAFSPQEGAAAGAANELANSLYDFNEALKKNKIGSKTLGKNFQVVSDYASTLAKATLNQAGSSLAAAWGTEKFSKMLSKSTNRIVPAIVRAQDAFGNYTNAFNMNAEQVSSSLAMYAFAHVDFAGKIKKASSERIAAEKKYISAMGNLDSMIKGMGLELEKLRSPAPEMTGILQQARGREEDIARDVADAIAASGAREKAAQKQSQLIALQELQTQVQGALVTATGTLISAIGHLIAALNKGETKESKAIVAQGISTQGMAKNLQSKIDAAAANVDFNALLAWDDEVKSATKKGNEASRTSTELTLEQAKANLKMGATIEGIIASVGVLNKKGKDAEQIVGSIPFSKIESGASSISDAFQKSMGKMLDSILSVEFDTKDNVTGGKFLGKDVSAKTMGKLAKARDVGAEIIDSIDINQIGASIGMGIGGLIGAFAGDPAIGAQIGKAVGTVIEAAVMFIPAVVKKITKGLSSAVNKAASFVPEQRFQGGVKKGMDSFSKAMMAMTPILVAAQAPFVMIGMLAGPLSPIVWGLQAFAIGIGIAASGFLALGPAIFGFLAFLGTQEMKYNRVVGSALDEDAGITELDDNYRTPFTRIMDALAVSIDRVIYAMGPFYENLFALVGLFDMVMEAFVIIADSLGDLDFGETLYEVFKQLALRVLEIITALAHMHNILVIGAQAHVWLNRTILQGAQVFLDFRMMMRDVMVSIFTGIGNWVNSLVPGNLGQDLINQAAELTTDFALGGEFADWDQWLIDTQGDMNDLIGDLAQFVDPSQFQPLYDFIQNSSSLDGLNRFNLLDRAASMDDGSADKAKEFGEQLTNVPSGFKVNLARFKAMDADGEGGAVDMGGGRSIMDIDATDFFGRMAEAVRSGTAQSLGSLTDAIGSLDEVIRPDNWEDIFGHPLDRMSNELGNAFDSLTNTLGLALLGPEEAFQGGGGMGAAMGGRQAGGNITSGSNTMNININELSIADAANPDQLANMIAERSSRDHMAQGGTPFPTTQSGANWWNGGGGKGS